MLFILKLIPPNTPTMKFNVLILEILYNKQICTFGILVLT